jgi:hypothetical protein
MPATTLNNYRHTTSITLFDDCWTSYSCSSITRRLRHKIISTSCTISPFPRMSFVGSPEPMFHSSVVKVIVPLPLASAVKFPISPLWYSPTPHFPCFLKVIPMSSSGTSSAAEQSDFSWIWIELLVLNLLILRQKSLYRFFR